MIFCKNFLTIHFDSWAVLTYKIHWISKLEAIYWMLFNSKIHLLQSSIQVKLNANTKFCSNRLCYKNYLNTLTNRILFTSHKIIIFYQIKVLRFYSIEMQFLCAPFWNPFICLNFQILISWALMTFPWFLGMIFSQLMIKN